MVGIERAWVAIHIEHGRNSFEEATFWFKNYGRTPAWVIGIEYDYRKFKTRLTGPLDTIVPRVIKNENGWILPPGIDSNPISKVIESDGKMSRDEYVAASNNTLFLVLFGTIRYRDIFGTDRKTLFCQNYMPNVGWALHGPEEFNRHT